MLTAHAIERCFRAGRWDALVQAISANGLELPLPLRARLAAHPSAAIALALRRLLELSYSPTSGAWDMVAGLLNLQDADGSFNHDPLATACAVAALGRVLAAPGGARAEGGLITTETLESPSGGGDRGKALTGSLCDPGQLSGGERQSGGKDGIPGNLNDDATAAVTRPCPTAAQITAARQRALAALAAMQIDGPGVGANPGDCGFAYHDDRTVEDRALVAAFIMSLLAGDAEFRQAVHFADLANWLDSHRRRLGDAGRALWSLARMELHPPSGLRRHVPGLAA